MRYEQGKPEELRHTFWEAMEDSPFVMLQLDADHDTAAPMTAQLDKEANHAIWFFTTRDSRFAQGGPATVTFSAKGHDVFARFGGTLSEETDRARLDKQWNNYVAAWYPQGKEDPSLLMLRMDLGPAAIWAGDTNLLGTVKMALGMDVRDNPPGSYTETKI